MKGILLTWLGLLTLVAWFGTSAGLVVIGISHDGVLDPRWSATARIVCIALGVLLATFGIAVIESVE